LRAIVAARSLIRKVYTAAGFDVIVDDRRAASRLPDGESNVERPSGLPGGIRGTMWNQGWPSCG
jgi:hypothetical protein